MPRFVASALTLTVACSAASPLVRSSAVDSLPIGAMLVGKSVRMRNVDGAMVSIDSVRGREGTLVIFTCNHCPWSRIWESRIVALAKRYQARGIGVIAINPNDPEAYEEDSFVDMQERARAADMSFPYVVDETGEVARAFGATKTPEAFLFDSQERLVYHGAVDDNANDPGAVRHPYLQEALDAVLTGEPVPRAQTKALGCAIKLRASSG